MPHFTPEKPDPAGEGERSDRELETLLAQARKAVEILPLGLGAFSTATPFPPRAIVRQAFRGAGADSRGPAPDQPAGPDAKAVLKQASRWRVLRRRRPSASPLRLARNRRLRCSSANGHAAEIDGVGLLAGMPASTKG